MRKIFVLAFVLFATSAISQNMGVGFRLGNISGITLKKYFSEKAFEISLGRSYNFTGDSWYFNHFVYWYKKNLPFSETEYLSHTKKIFPFGIQLNFLSQRDLKKADSEVGTLDWYFGFGAQFHYQSYYYDYRYKVSGDPVWYYATDRVNDINLGADGILGLEYTFSSAPVSVFLDFTLFMEVYDDPFIFNGQGGIGVRYNF